jgi:hypothetical protein
VSCPSKLAGHGYARERLMEMLRSIAAMILRARNPFKILGSECTARTEPTHG